MARGSKQSSTSKPRRQASHIEDGAQIASTTADKQDGDGTPRGRGRAKAGTMSAAKASPGKRASTTSGGRKRARTTTTTRGGSKAPHAKAARAARA